MGKHFEQDAMNSEAEKNNKAKSHNVYKKAAGNLTAVILCIFVIGPILYVLYAAEKSNSGSKIFLGLAVIGVAITIIACLICAVENYMWAKDAEWTEIIEKLDQINYALSKLNKLLDEP